MLSTVVFTTTALRSTRLSSGSIELMTRFALFALPIFATAVPPLSIGVAIFWGSIDRNATEKCHDAASRPDRRSGWAAGKLGREAGDSDRYCVCVRSRPRLEAGMLGATR